MKTPAIRFWPVLLISVLLGTSGCGRPGGSLAQAEQPAAAKGASTDHPFPNRKPAPALEGGTEWLNTSGPLELKDLRGKFVVLDFWTYCCINCMHILPELKKLEHKYPNNVVVIGVHSGKFDTEHDAEGIRQAIMRYEIEHPVVNDAEYKIWNGFDCRSWPSLRVIDPEGNVVAGNSGEIDFATLNRFFEENLPYYRDHGLLDEKPIRFDRESAKAAQTPLCYPGKILADEKSGRLFIADSNHNRIVIASLDGAVQAVIGSGAIGHADGDFKTAQFNHPQGMALAGDILYVADTENHLLRRIDLKNRQVKTAAGTGRQAHSPWMDDNSAPTELDLNSPWALAIQGNKLFIAMAGAHQIWEMPLDESKIRPYAGNGREDIVDGALLSPRPFQPGYSSFAQPSGLATDGKWLFVADSEGSSVRAVPLENKKDVKTLIGTADLSDARLFTFGDLDGPNGVARLQHCLDVAYRDGRIYVADTYNSKIKVIDLKSGQCTTLAGIGKRGYEDATDPRNAKFFEPAGLSYAAGKLFVADTNNHRIRVVTLAKDGGQATDVKTLELAGLEPPQAAGGPSK